MNSRFVMVAEGGDVGAEVAAPKGMNAYACMLGGADGRTLLMCCSPGHAPEDRERARSVVLSTRVDVPPEDRERARSVVLSTRVDVPHAGLP